MYRLQTPSTLVWFHNTTKVLGTPLLLFLHQVTVSLNSVYN